MLLLEVGINGIPYRVPRILSFLHDIQELKIDAYRMADPLLIKKLGERHQLGARPSSECANLEPPFFFAISIT
jgi:hypothetical protein